MGVSVEGTNVDLNAIVQGGDAFLARINELNAAKTKADAALADLKLGQSAKDAFASADAKIASASKLLADAQEAASKTITDANRQAADILTQANNDAAGIIAAAQAKHDADAIALDAEVKTARDDLAAWTVQTKAATQKALDDAIAAKTEADRLLSIQAAAADKLATSQAAADAALASAQAAEADFKAKSARLAAALAG